MSGPYDSYGGGYNQGSQYPQGGYSQQGGYPPQQGHSQGGYPPQQDYSSYPTGDQNFGPPRRTDSFGPPQQGGFQHGQSNYQMGGYDASNPQGHGSYYGQGSNDAFSQNQQYQQHMGQQAPYGSQQQGSDPLPQTAPQSTDPNAPNYDPNAPPMTEQDRGLLGAAAGAFGGHHFGKKANHGFLGTIGGAIVGSLAEDFAKSKKKQHHSGNSSWGGSKY